ncbi:MAG TPA: cation diffusion facilitator family transporter [Candidatus Eisenbacteria bacterium]|nr:cation diffusion facilitator family transporter [Candidatus Eisenbacteria bacterium]
MHVTLVHERAARRLDRVARILWWTLWLNLAVAVAKLIYGWRSGAIAMTADGIHSLLDASSNVVGLVGVAVARRPPDANHPYGHRKYETFAALGIVLMLLLGCREVIASVIERMREPAHPVITPLGFAIVGFTLAVNIGVAWVEHREGKRLGSELLTSDAAHTASDVAASLLVLLSFLAVRAGAGWADLVVAIVIVALIAVAAVRILMGTLSTLSDERTIAPELVEAEALGVTGVLEAHNVRSRGPADDIHLDLHILVDPRMAIASAHALGHRVEERLRERWPGLTDVVVHVEPALESERATAREGGGLKAEG